MIFYFETLNETLSFMAQHFLVERRLPQLQRMDLLLLKLYTPQDNCISTCTRFLLFSLGTQMKCPLKLGTSFIW